MQIATPSDFVRYNKDRSVAFKIRHYDAPQTL